jgi:HK97 gp10 family phage protein
VANFQIEGLEPALAKMKGLSQKMQAKGVRSAAVKAMRIVRDAARVKARQLDDPETASNIAKNIQTRNDAKGGKRIGGVLVKVGVVGGARPAKGTVDTGHWRFLEFGNSHQRAQPFMRPALENNIGRVTDSFVTNLNSEIDKIMAKGL